MPDSITQLLHAWREGDEAAGFDLDRLLRAELLAVVRRRRSPQLRALIDSEGVVNAAFKSFLSGVLKDEFPAIQGRGDIRRLLSRFAICVLRDQARAETTMKRDVSRAIALDSGVLNAAADPSQTPPEERCREIEYGEKIREIVRPVHPNAINVLEMTIEGLSKSQIASELNLGVRTVQVIVKGMQDTWEEWILSEGEDESRPPSAHPGG